jgi:hypothetical protein
MAPVGTSNAPRSTGPLASLPDAAPAGPPRIPADFRERLTKMNRARFVSKGHAAGRWEVDVYANEAGAKALRDPRTEVPEGAVFVEEHVERAPESHQGPLMMLEKMSAGFDAAHHDWRYVVLGANGDLEGDGSLDGCTRCHDSAPHDHLFVVDELLD